MFELLQEAFAFVASKDAAASKEKMIAHAKGMSSETVSIMPTAPSSCAATCQRAHGPRPPSMSTVPFGLMRR